MYLITDYVFTHFTRSFIVYIYNIPSLYYRSAIFAGFSYAWKTAQREYNANDPVSMN